MALGTVNSDVAAKQADPYFGNRVDPIQGAAGEFNCDVLYEIGTGLAATDIINLIRIPERFKLLPHKCWIELENPGTALVLDVGLKAADGSGYIDADDSVADDPDRFVDGITLSAGGGFAFTGADGVHTQTPFTTEKESWVYATVITATSLTAGQKIRFYLSFAANT